MDRNLWLEQWPFGKVPPPREQVDGNVMAFQALDPNTVYVLGTDGNLWLEHGPFGAVPPSRQHVDANVKAFQAADSNDAWVLDTNGNLWVEATGGLWGTTAATRSQIDANVAAFQGIDITQIFTLGTDGNLWLEDAYSGTIPPSRQQVDANVAAFQALDANMIYVLGSDGNLWLEHAPFGAVPPTRQQVDGNVEDFQAIDENTIYVLGTDGNLWREVAPFGKVPPSRVRVDANVQFPTQFGTVRPTYQILTLIYAPPGTNGGKSSSSVSYSSGSSMGSTVSTSNSFQDGMEIDATVTAGPVTGGVDFNFSKTKTDGSSLQSNKSTTFTITRPGPAADGINHGEDVFYLWLNPELTVSVDPKNRLSWALSADGANMTVPYVYVSWLQNPSSMDTNVKKQLDAAGLTQSDYDTILSINPFASGATAIDPNRYQLIGQFFDYEAPLSPSDPVLTETYNLTNSVTSTSIQTTEIDYGVGFSVETSAGFPSLFNAKLKVSENFKWTNTNSQSQQSQSTQTASAIIGGPAFGYTGPPTLLLYWDSIYSTFMFVLQ